MNDPFLLPIAFDLSATFLMAMTGVWAASRRGYDAVGAFTLAFVSGVGGGLLRDAILLKQVPVIVQDSRYLLVVSAAVFVGGVAHHPARKFGRLIACVDALALGGYVVVGADKALVAGLPLMGAVLVGMTNAVGGGLLRDILVREEPLVFKPGQLYVLAALCGCTTFVVLWRVADLPRDLSPWIAIATTLLLRFLAIRFNWTTVPVSAWNPRTPPSGE